MNISPGKWLRLIYIHQLLWILIVVSVTLIISIALGAVVPQLVNKLYENFETDFFTYFNILAAMFIAQYFNRAIYQLSVNKYVQKLLGKVRGYCYEKWIRSYEHAQDKRKEEYPLGEVLARIMNDSESVRELITSGSFGIIIDFCFIISCLVSFLLISTDLGLILLITEVLICFALIYGSKYMARVFMDVRKAIGMVFRTLANITGGASQTYYTRHDNYASKKSKFFLEDFLKKQLTANVWDASYYSVAESLFPLLLLLLVFSIPFVNIIEVAVIGTIIDLIQRSIHPIKNIAGKISNIQRAYTGIVRIQGFIDDLELTVLSPLEKNFEPLQVNEIEFQLEEFAYPRKTQESRDEFKLKNINFMAKAGEPVGLVGMSGSGKSTLLNILSLNIVPENLKITLKTSVGTEAFDFCCNRDKQIPRFREQVGIVSQDSHIFSESLKFNIMLGFGSDDDFNDFWAESTQAIPYIKTFFPDPLHEVNISMLSMGQKQLICALRACYLKKPIVLFDEVSSGLDSSLEQALRSMIEFVQRQALTFIVTHRLETIQNASQIIVLDRGEVESIGTHKELLISSPSYQSFIKQIRH